MKTKYLLLLGLILFFHVSARAGNGIIRVKVYDEKTGEPLIGANVVISGTTNGNVTDLDGTASIMNLASGDYSVQVSYVSYQTKIISDIHLDENQVKIFDVRLSEESLDLNEVVVSAKAIRNNENALLTLQKKSPATFDAITADQFSKNGDNNAASALKRVTGVTITDGKYVYVRGLGDRYSKSILNGAEIPGLDPNRNSVQLDLFPSNLIDNIIVYKTFTPDLEGDFSGGLVDINTRDFPDNFNVQVSAGVGYNSQANLTGNFLKAETSPTDFLGFDNGLRRLPNVLRPYTPETFPQPYIGNQSDLTRTSRAFHNSFLPATGVQPLNHNFNLSVGDQFLLFGKQLGFIFGLSYNRKYKNYTNGIENIFEGISQGQTNLDRDVLYSSNEQKSVMNVLTGALLNTSYKIDPNNQVGVILMTNQSGTNDIRSMTGYRLDFSPDSTTRQQNRAISWQQRSFDNAQLRGEHRLPGLWNTDIKWMSSLTESRLYQPDFRLIRNTFQLSTNGEDTLYSFGNNDRPSRYYRSMNEISSNSKLDLTVPLKVFSGREGKIKFGGLYTYKNRNFHEDLFDYNIQDVGDFYTSGNITRFFEADRLGYVNGNLKNFLNYYSYPDNNFDAYQRLYAGYGMVELPLTKEVRVTTGVRFEKTLMNLKSSGDAQGTINTNDFLPSLAFTWAVNEKTNLRASASRTLARPSFREFAPLATFDFLGGYIQNGNEKLERTLINNFDLRYERFSQTGGYFSFSLFYKKFLNPIENAQLPTAGGSESQFQYKNVPQSQLYGAEIELRKNLGDFTQALENFRISSNLTYVYSYVNVTDAEYLAISAWNNSPSKKRPMFNQAPYAINANLNYANRKNTWESTVSFNVTGKRLIVYQVDLPSIFLQPMAELNFTVKRQLNRNLSIRGGIENILNSPYQEQISIGSRNYYTSRFSEGRIFSVSLKYFVE